MNFTVNDYYTIHLLSMLVGGIIGWKSNRRAGLVFGLILCGFFGPLGLIVLLLFLY